MTKPGGEGNICGLAPFLALTGDGLGVTLGWRGWQGVWPGAMFGGWGEWGEMCHLSLSPAGCDTPPAAHLRLLLTVFADSCIPPRLPSPPRALIFSPFIMISRHNSTVGNVSRHDRPRPTLLFSGRRWRKSLLINFSEWGVLWGVIFKSRLVPTLPICEPRPGNRLEIDLASLFPTARSYRVTVNNT